MSEPGTTRDESLILIVEDSPTQAEQLKYMLEKHGYRVRAVGNGREALASLGREKPITVISDIVMPEMDGYELCRRIKANQEFYETPVILLTSLSDPEDVIMGLECGADFFIMKPYNELFLLSRIQHILANRTLRDMQGVRMGLEIFFRGKKYFINSDRLQILNLLLSTYENAIQKNHELADATEELALLNEQLQENMAELESLNQKLLRVNEELQQQREVAEEARRQAIAANRAKSDFLANMSHELRTPLNSVIGFSEVLQDELFGGLNDKQREYVGNILFSGRHLLSLINDILDLAKIESGKMVLDLKEVTLSHLLADSLTMLQEKALKHGIRLDLEPGSEELCLLADERKLKQIMFNLLSNAVKFTPDGGRVSVQARNIREEGDGEADLVEISVADTGVGIREDDLPKLFTEFSQLSSPYTKAYEGTGLGLALTKRLVELHGGTVRAESTFGEGSRFSFVMPRRQEAEGS